MANKGEERTKGKSHSAGGEPKRESEAGSAGKANPDICLDRARDGGKKEDRPGRSHKCMEQTDMDKPQAHMGGVQMDAGRTQKTAEQTSARKPQSSATKTQLRGEILQSDAAEKQLGEEDIETGMGESRSSDYAAQPGPQKNRPTATAAQPGPQKDQPTATAAQPGPQKNRPTATAAQPGPQKNRPTATAAQSGPKKNQPTADVIKPAAAKPQADSAYTDPAASGASFDQTWEQSGANSGRDGVDEQRSAGREAGERPASRRKSSRSRGKLAWAVLIIIGTAALVILCMQIYFRVYVRGFDSNKIIQGVSIGRMDVSGLTASQAGERLESELSDRQKAVLTLKLDDGRQGEVLVKSLDITVKNMDSAIKKAVEYGKKGNALECYKIMRQAEKNKNKKDFLLQYKIKKEDAPVVYKSALSMVMKFPQNAKVMQTESGVTVVEGAAGELPDVDKTTRSIEDFLTNKWNGRDAQVKAYASHQEPKLKASDLKDINAVIGTFSTNYAREAYATAVNVESGTLHLNGAFLKPGEEFSANATAKPYIVENGYINAASDKGDMLGAPMGGGISQVSSTLYMAALYAELDVTRRTPNPSPVSYIKPSMDAAIAEGKDDLRFKNNMKTPIYIEGLLSNGHITFNIYGKETRDPGRKLDFVSETTQESKPQGKHFVATPDTAGSYYTLNPASPAVTARLWKIIYKDGQEQKREIVNTSQYAASEETIAVGTVSEDKALSKRITDAIKTQNEAVILNAIGKGQP